MEEDVIIVGGSFAGLSAALQIARGRRKVLVIDAQRRRNRFVEASHGFITHDGDNPASIVATARAQLLRYPNASIVDGEAVAAQKTDGGFLVETAAGQRFASRRLVLATGVVDILPDIPGLAERWGKAVFMCPYCDGYELDNAPLGVLATSPLSMHQAMLIPEWGPTTFFTNGAFEPDDDQRRQLRRRGVALEPARVTGISGEHAEMGLADGRAVRLRGLFLYPSTRLASPVAEQLGCAMAEGPMGPYVGTQPNECLVPGVFACGDTALPFGSVAIASGDGARAGGGAHQSLVFGED